MLIKIGNMKRMCTGISVLGMILLFFIGCASKKQGRWLDAHYQILDKAANSNIPPEKKMDILAQSYTDMMHQSLNFVNPEKAVKYAKAYSKQNNANIAKILNDVGVWQKGMGTLESIGLGVRMMKKPYAKDMVELFPRFRKKFKTYTTVMVLSGKVRRQLLNAGGEKLKDLFD